MIDSERIRVVRELLEDYVRSPSLRHIRDPYSVSRLAAEIVRRLDRGGPIWRKWDAPRETLVKSAALCWIPVDDLRDYLNDMPGALLTSTDVAQRLRAFHEEPYEPYPNNELKESCLALYEAEKAKGTELPAIIGLLQEHVEDEEERLRQARERQWRERAEEERLALEQRFLSGADCKWTPLDRSKEFYCRINGRAYRLSPTPDKKWALHRIDNAEDEGVAIGKYATRGDVTKALKELAYKPEPRW